MPRDRTGLYMAAAALVFAVIAQIGIFAIANSSKVAAPVAEAMNEPAK